MTALHIMYYIRLATFHVTYEQRERVFHRDIQTGENDGEYTSAKRETVFLLIIFECLDIAVGHELELFIWLLK